MATSTEPSAAPRAKATRVAAFGLERLKRTPAPRIAIPRGKRRIILSASQLSQFGDVQVVKGIADAKHEKSHQKQTHQHVEKDSDLDDQWHAKCGRQSRKENPILQNQKAHHLHKGFLAADHEKRAR